MSFFEKEKKIKNKPNNSWPKVPATKKRRKSSVTTVVFIRYRYMDLCLLWKNGGKDKGRCGDNRLRVCENQRHNRLFIGRYGKMHGWWLRNRRLDSSVLDSRLVPMDEADHVDSNGYEKEEKDESDEARSANKRKGCSPSVLVMGATCEILMSNQLERIRKTASTKK